MAKVQIEMLVPMSGPDKELDREAGKHYMVDAEEAERLFEREFARPVQAKRQPRKPRETATRSSRETATRE